MKGDHQPGRGPSADEPSLDPRTWLNGRTGAQGEGTAATARTGDPDPGSFDPKTWGGGVSRPENPDVPGRESAGPDRRALLMGLAGGGALLVGGGAIWAFRSRKRATLTSDAASAPPAMASNETSYVAPAVDGFAGLEQRLANYRVPADQIRAAVAALRGAAGGDPGRMHLIIRLRNADGDRPDLTGAELRRVLDGVGYQLLREGDVYRVSVLAAELTSRLIAHPRGQVNRDGLYASAVGDLSPDLMTQFAEALAFDFDIAQEVREGDQFEVVHQEQRDARGNLVGGQKLQFAFLSAGGKDRYLYRFKPTGQDDGWFDDRGKSTRQAFMRTPLDGARITSLFGERVHPVFHSVRMHKGVDFGCGIGTHIFAAADGVVDYAGPATGFGVLLKLRHDNGLETWYGHLSEFPDGIAPGAAVKQGQLVALSGNVGFSTGPHLHYEVHKDGVAVDPKDFLDVQGAMGGAGAQTLEGPVLTAFLTFKDEIDIIRRSQT